MFDPWARHAGPSATLVEPLGQLHSQDLSQFRNAFPDAAGQPGQSASGASSSYGMRLDVRRANSAAVATPDTSSAAKTLSAT